MLILCEEDLTKVEDLPDENYFYRFGLVDKYEGIYENFDFFTRDKSLAIIYSKKEITKDPRLLDKENHLSIFINVVRFSLNEEDLVLY